MPRPCPLACKHCLNRLGGTGPKSRQVGSRASEAVAALTQHGRSRDQPLLAMPTCLNLPLLLLSLPPAAGRDWHVCPEAGAESQRGDDCGEVTGLPMQGAAP